MKKSRDGDKESIGGTSVKTKGRLLRCAETYVIQQKGGGSILHLLAYIYKQKGRNIRGGEKKNEFGDEERAELKRKYVFKR